MGVTTELIPRILRDMNDGVLALDKSGRIIYMNPQSRELFQLTEEAIGKTYAEVFFGEHQGKEKIRCLYCLFLRYRLCMLISSVVGNIGILKNQRAN